MIIVDFSKNRYRDGDSTNVVPPGEPAGLADLLARRRVHALVDERCRRLSLWVGIQAAADRAHFAGKSRTRSLGQLNKRMKR